MDHDTVRKKTFEILKRKIWLKIAIFDQKFPHNFWKYFNIIIYELYFLVTEPWIPLRIIQDYLGVEQYITKDNFVENPDLGMTNMA